MTKTGVAEIIVVDDDNMQLKNLMRSPGGANKEEMTRIQKGKVKKIEYHAERYKEAAVEVVRVDEKASKSIGAMLKKHGVGFAFVCIDQAGGEVKGRQDDVYEGLQEVGIRFVDSGISLATAQGQITGAVTTTYCGEGENTWKGDIPNAGIRGAENWYHNVQVPEINALAGAMAVIEWRRRTGQYVDERESGTRVGKYRVEDNISVNNKNDK